MNTASIALFLSIFTFMASPVTKKEAKTTKKQVVQTACSDHKFEKLMSTSQRTAYPNYRLLLSNWQKIN